MEKLHLSSKQTFVSASPKVVILDCEGNPFFALSGSGRLFTLPQGVFSVYGDIAASGTPVVYHTKIKLPPAEKNRVAEKEMRIVVKLNPNKCSVVRDGKGRTLIIIDPSINSLPLFAREYVIEHELAHEYYETETYCDAMAEARLLKRGFNPSQIEAANRIALDSGYRHDANKKRMQNFKRN